MTHVQMLYSCERIAAAFYRAHQMRVCVANNGPFDNLDANQAAVHEFCRGLSWSDVEAIAEMARTHPHRSQET